MEERQAARKKKIKNSWVSKEKKNLFAWRIWAYLIFIRRREHPEASMKLLFKMKWGGRPANEDEEEEEEEEKEKDEEEDEDKEEEVEEEEEEEEEEGEGKEKRRRGKRGQIHDYIRKNNYQWTL